MSALTLHFAKLERLLGPPRLTGAGKAWMVRDIMSGRAEMEAARLQVKIAREAKHNGNLERAWEYVAKAQDNVIRAYDNELRDEQRQRLNERPNIGGRKSKDTLAQILYLAAQEEEGTRIADRCRKAISKHDILRDYGFVRDDTLRKAYRKGKLDAT